MPKTPWIRTLVKVAITVSLTMNVAYTVNEVKETFVDERETHYHLALSIEAEKGKTQVYMEGDSLVVETGGKKRVWYWPLKVD